jgi:hypothetical protein
MVAVVVDSYAKVKEDIEIQESDSDIFSDCYVATINGFKGVIHRWPTGLAKKLQTKLVLRGVADEHLEHALDISSTTARSIIDAYLSNEVLRYNRSEMSGIDALLLKRTANVLGYRTTYNLLRSDMTKIQMNKLEENQVCMASSLDKINISQETFRKEVLAGQDTVNISQETFRKEVLELLKSSITANSTAPAPTTISSQAPIYEIGSGMNAQAQQYSDARNFAIPTAGLEASQTTQYLDARNFAVAGSQGTLQKDDIQLREGLNGPSEIHYSPTPPPRGLPPTFRDQSEDKSPNTARASESESNSIMGSFVFWQ